jgi:F-type H+-transporting ATPase subunit b|tara:strand:- start:1164 stop:1661 length:498 start_codon:yes stop_codon:yes gene_type:complete
MIIDASFWVAVSFLIFIGLIIYFKIPQKIKFNLEENINNIKSQIDIAENLKEEAKGILSEHEKKISNSKIKIKEMISKANEDAEKNILKTNENFHTIMEIKKKNTDDKIKQMKEQTLKDIKNISVKIAVGSVERLLISSLDKSKLDKLYIKSIEETKLALKIKSN